MYFLKDTHCSDCGGDNLVVPAHIKDENGKDKIVVDSGVCQDCLREYVLPDDEYHMFGRRYCYVRKDAQV